MKLRIRDNTVRFRLTRTEVERLAAGEAVVQVTRFSIDHQLVCSITPTAEAVARITFDDGRLLLEIPGPMFRGWHETTEVGIAIEQRVDAGSTLSVLVEKDFACLHRGADDTPDAYPNPRL